MRRVFGPVPSKRLGQSLGIDPVPFKTCNWNCVYCQLGRTTPLTNERREFFAPAEIVADVRAALEVKRPEEVDWVTFAASGEPTLHAGLGRIIRQVKALTPAPVAVLTNGSLLYRPEVREELAAADAVLPTLDAGTPSLYRTINRPFPQLTFDRLVEGLAAFRRIYTGKLWIEVMLVKGLNDTEAALADLAEVLSGIGPDEVQINVPTRPPAEPWVEPPEPEGLSRAAEILGDIAQVIQPAAGRFELLPSDNVVDAVLAVISRHPMQEEQLMRTLAEWTSGQLAQALEALTASGKAQVVVRHGERFWSTATARYAEKGQKQGPR